MATLCPMARRPFTPVEAGSALATRIAYAFWPAITYADLFLTEQCNQRCSYCFVKGKNARRMSAETADGAVEFLIRASKEHKRASILFFGGEPLLEFDLIRWFVEEGARRFAAAGKELRFDITTNGTLMSEDMARYFRDRRIMVLLSIDGDRETHDAERMLLGGGSSYDAVMERVPMMKRYQPWLGTRLTVHPRMVHALARNVRLLFSKGINQFIVGPATGTEWSHDDLHAYEEQMYIVADLYRAMKERGFPFRITLFEKNLEHADGRWAGVWGCGAGRGRICVSAVGDLYGCAKILGVDSLGVTHKLGDVWRGITALAKRRDLLNCSPAVRPMCAKCAQVDDCTGGCPATNYEATGSIFDPSPLECALVPIVKRIKARLVGEEGPMATDA